MMNIPNILTLLRLVLTLGFVWVFWVDIVTALVLFLLAALTDFFDGYLARRYHRITPFGKIMDPVADKCLMLSAFAVLSIARLVPWWMFGVIAVREIGVTAFRFWAMARGKVLAAEQAGKVKTVVQIFTVVLMLVFRISTDYWGTGGLYQRQCTLGLYVMAIALLWVSIIITFVSGVLVFWNNRTLLMQGDRKKSGSRMDGIKHSEP